PSPSVRSASASVWSAPSRCTRPTSTRSRCSLAVMSVVRSSTTCANCAARLLASAKRPDLAGTVGDDHTVPNRHEDATFGSRLLCSARFWKTIGAIAILIVLLGGSIRGFVIQRFTIPSASMEPTLDVDDSITVWRPDALSGDIQRGDIVVFDGRGSFIDDALPSPLQKMGSWVGLGPRAALVVFDGRGSFIAAALPSPLQKMGSWVGLGPRDVYYVKRVIAVGGDTLQCCDGQGRLLLNDEPLNEDYAPDPASAVEFSVEVPADTMWVMGDNRNDSADSRSLLGRPGGGFIPTDRVIGTVIGHGSSID